MVTELVPGIHWVGAVDWRIKQFHGHELSIHRGTTYNSYLIVDEKVAVVDTVMAPYAGDFLENIRSLVDPARIDYIVINHSEPDHAGALPALRELCPRASWWCPSAGRRACPGTSMKIGRSAPCPPATGFRWAAGSWPSSRRRCCTGRTACSPTSPATPS